jgi:hypothetical protein
MQTLTGTRTEVPGIIAHPYGMDFHLSVVANLTISLSCGKLAADL